MMRKTIRAVLFANVWALSAAAASAAVQYTWQSSTSGDTVAMTYLSDSGDLVLGGFGDACFSGGGKAAVLVYGAGGYGGREFVVGLPRGTPEPQDCGVDVSERNAAGDMIGSSTVGVGPGRASVPTFWRGGVAYDLTDPANAGLVFVPDPGFRRIGGMDLSTLDIIAPDLAMRSGSDFHLRALFTNSLGMIAAESRLRNNPGFVLFPTATVSEPSGLLLVLAAGGAAFAAARSQGANVSRRRPANVCGPV